MGCSGCQASCNSCEGCDSGCQVTCKTCQGCDSGCQVTCKTCEGCDNCESCDDCQTFCETNQAVGSFNFGKCVNQGEIFISANSWKSLMTYIQNAYKKGTLQSGGSSGLSNDNLNVKSGDPMKATMYNNVANALNGLGGSSDDSRISNDVQKGYTILGSYFSGIETYSNKWLLSTSQCDLCNTGCQSCDDGCQVTCKSCEGCDSGCQGCDSCQGCNSGCQVTCKSCQGCNDCLGCESTCDTCQGCYSHVEPESSDD